MKLTDKVKLLKKEIFSQLSPLVTGDYVLYDLPYHNNIGDLLIWLGELAFLERFPYCSKGFCSFETFRPFSPMASDTIIFLQGGGNFGDVWVESQKFRFEIIQRYPNNKIVMFPQTVFYHDEGQMRKDANIMAKHPDLTLCARDKVSYMTLKENFQNQVLLVPDMAFCIPTEQLKKKALEAGDKTLFLKRADRELKEVDYTFRHRYPLEVSDWVTMEHWDMVQIGMQCLFLLRKKCDVSALMNWYANRVYRDNLVEKGVEFISRYREIYTTRLHVAILSMLLGKPFHLLDNSYGKNRAFFETWLTGVEGIDWVG